MKNYTVECQVLLTTEVDIQANSISEAHEIAEKITVDEAFKGNKISNYCNSNYIDEYQLYL